MVGGGGCGDSGGGAVVGRGGVMVDEGFTVAVVAVRYPRWVCETPTLLAR